MSLGINKLEAIELPKPKYIDDNGVEQDVDLKIVASSDHVYEYQNTTNLIKTYFKKNISDYTPIKVVVADHFFEWTPFGVGFADEHGNEEWFGRINDAPAEVEGNKVTYKNLLHGIDDEFIVNVGELKHNTILNSKPVYNQTLPGKQISVVVDGIIDFSTDIDMFVDDALQEDEFETSSEIQFKGSSGEIVFTLPSPTTYEINGIESIQCIYKVIKIGSVISLKIFTPYDWIKDASRTYPVAIDPTLSLKIDGVNLSQVSQATFSNNTNFLFANVSGGRARLFRIDQLRKTLEETPFSKNNGYLNTTVDSRATFSVDDKYLFCGSSYLNIYKYNSVTNDYDTVTYTTTQRTGAVYMEPDGKFFFRGAAYTIECSEFDHTNGTLKVLSTVGTSYYPRKMYLTKNKKYLFCQQGVTTNFTFRIHPFNNGVLSVALTLPSFLNQLNIADFTLSADEKYIILGLTVAPFIYICPFNSDSGTIGPPINTNIDIENVTVGCVELSRKNQYLVLSQARSASQPRFSIYKFNIKTGQIEGRIQLDPSLTHPSALSYSLEFSSDGSLMSYSQNALTPNSLFLYQFFYEPEDNIFFKDPATEDYYSDNKGNTLMLIDFGTIVAGQTTSPKKILLENCYDYAVNNIQLSLSNPSQEFRVELSETDLPFIPQQTLSFNQTLNTRESIPFYIRVTTTDQSQSGGMFEVLAKCDVV